MNWASASAGILVAALILFLVRRDHLHTRYALWWIVIALLIGLLGLFPKLNDILGASLGISYPPIIPLMLGLLALVIKVLFMDIERSRNEVKLNRLVQRLALLEQRMDNQLKKE